MTGLAYLAETKRNIILFLKEHGRGDTGQLATHLSLSLEAVRRQLLELKNEGWVTGKPLKKENHGRSGRPSVFFHLTLAGEHLFPKRYDQLFLTLLDTISETKGHEGTLEILAQFTEKRIREFAGKLENLNLPEKLEALKNLYWEGDPYVKVERDNRGYRLIEYNCPLLGVAMKRPVVCSSSVYFLSKLLGVKVVREERFQDGEGRCVFRILDKQPRTAEGFCLEPAP